MRTSAFDSVTRRASLAVLGTSGLATLLQADVAAAKKKRGKKKKGDVNKLCKPQVAQCEAIFTPQCGGDPECLAVVDQCCPLIGTCNFAGMIDCFQAAQNVTSALSRLGR